MMFRPSRQSPGPDPHLDLKMAIFTLGAAFGLAGIFLDNRILIGMAIGTLLLGILIRIRGRGADEPEDPSDPEDVD